MTWTIAHRKGPHQPEWDSTDRVSIYLPMIPEAQVAMLACARIGAPHSVVFSAFSAESLKDRILDAGSKVLVTCDGYPRRGRPVNLKNNADQAVEGTEVRDVIVYKRTGQEVNWVEGRVLLAYGCFSHLLNLGLCCRRGLPM